MLPISTSATFTAAAPAAFPSSPKYNFGPEKRAEISTFLMRPVSEQHTDAEIITMLMRAFNTGSYRHAPEGRLFLWGVEFNVPVGEVCVAPPEVELNGCWLISAGTMVVSSGTVSAGRHGGTVVATGVGAVARACAFGARAIAGGDGAIAQAENSGVAYATVPGASAMAYFGGSAYADSVKSEVHAVAPNSYAHARVAGASAFACEIDSSATARNGAVAVAKKSGAIARAINASSIASAIVRGSIAYSTSKGALAIGKDGGKAIATVDGAIAENRGKRMTLRTLPLATYETRNTGGQMSITEVILAKKIAADRQRSGVNFQGRFGNEAITADDLGLNDELPPLMETDDNRKINGKMLGAPVRSAESDWLNSGAKFQGKFGNESITAEDLGLNDD